MERFEYQLKLNNYSLGRIEKYWSFLRTIHQNLGVCFDKAERKDIEALIIKIDTNAKWSNYTKLDFKKIAKFFFRWLLTGNLEGDYPDMVKWMKIRMKKNNQTPPEQILTKEEIELLANNTNNPRDRALILTLYESGCRIGEILNMKIKDISFDNYGCFILVSGKTGWRRVRIINYSKDLLNWLDIHPLKSNSDSYVWINSENQKEIISPSRVNRMIKDIAKKCNITKRVNPHSFRHARATHLAKQLPEAIMKEMFGWTRDSRMAGIYYHLDGKDVDEALLKINGIKIKEDDQEKNVGIRICSKCGENNTILSHFCKKCNNPLDFKLIMEIEREERRFMKLLRDFLVFQAEKDKNFKKVFVQFVKDNKAEDLFLVETKE
jgi:integrase/ribosomal protein L40E